MLFILDMLEDLFYNLLIIMILLSANCIGNVILKGELITEDGVEKMHFTSVDIDLSIDDITVRIENIFGGDKALGM